MKSFGNFRLDHLLLEGSEIKQALDLSLIGSKALSERELEITGPLIQNKDKLNSFPGLYPPYWLIPKQSSLSLHQLSYKIENWLLLMVGNFFIWFKNVCFRKKQEKYLFTLVPARLA